MASAVPNDIKVIDADTHVIEPADLWTSRISKKKWGAKIPHVRWNDDTGEECWYSGSKAIIGTAGPAMAFWNEYPPGHPRSLAEAHPATTQVAERVKVMDEFGMHAQVLYPDVAGFGVGRFTVVDDRELMLACVRAYNDFLVEEYVDAHPGRFIAVGAVPFWDIEAASAEIQRAAEIGHKGIIMSSQPEDWGQPPLTSLHWDPIWALAQDLELSVNFHIGSGDFSSSLGEIRMTSGEFAGSARFASFGTLLFLGNAGALSSIIFGGICHRFPRLRFVSVESGIGWLPFALEAMNWQWKNCGVHLEHPEYDLLPSEYFRRQIYGCFWFEGDVGKMAIDLLGDENFLYETDFPHPTCMAPGPATSAVTPREYLDGFIAGLPEKTVRKILHDNAARLYHVE